VPDRSRIQVILYILALVALIAGVTGLTVAITQNRHTAAALATEIRQHCRADAATSNRQRTLDLGLIASDQAYLAILRREAERPASAHDENLIDGQTVWLRKVLHVRMGDLPPYRDPAKC
jgi:type VI protein secretion system component VasK